MQFSTPESAMRHALMLAERGLGLVEPNPPVGAVIVDGSGVLISEGWHQKFGGPHAEVLALAAAGERARGATLYCTLEPCSHFGKTPPCAPGVIHAGIRRVVVGTGDPAPHVNGRGIALLREAGIEVQLGVCEVQARRLIAPFVKLMLEQLPWVHAKWAMSLDGRIATRTGNSKWITSEASRQRAHLLRGRCDAVIVGIQTVLADDPLLTARPAGPRVATRIVLDSHARIPLNCQLIRSADQSPVLIVVGAEAPSDRIKPLRSSGVEILIPSEVDTLGRPSLRQLLRELGQRGMTHLLIEGGAGVLGSAFDQQLVDECHVFVAPRIIGGVEALSPVGGLGAASMPQVSQLTSVQMETVASDLYIRGDVLRSN